MPITSKTLTAGGGESGIEVGHAGRTAAGTRRLRVLYQAGPGDVAGTFRHWRAGRDDPRLLAIAYSRQFFDACLELDAEALVITSHGGAGEHEVADERFRIIDRPVPWVQAGGLRFHLGRLAYGLTLAWHARRFKADVALINTGTHWFALSVLALLGVAVVPTLHNTFWPAGHRPDGWASRWLHRLNGWFWRRVATATVCVSPECVRQIEAIAGRPRGPVIQVWAPYRRETFADLPTPPPLDAGPCRVLYAGRIERSKGVFGLLDVAEQLHRQHPGRFQWDVCGDGTAIEELAAGQRQRGLGNVFHLHGQLDAQALRQMYGRCHVVVVPTTAGFTEGLNKVAVEAVLAGRPVVTSAVSHAVDVLGEAVVEVPAEDWAAFRQAIERLALDAPWYESRRAACRAVRAPFFDPQRHWAAAVKQVLADAAAARGLAPPMPER